MKKDLKKIDVEYTIRLEKEIYLSRGKFVLYKSLSKFYQWASTQIYRVADLKVEFKKYGKYRKFTNNNNNKLQRI